MHQTSKLGLRPGVGPRNTGAPLHYGRTLSNKTAHVAKAPVAAPAAPAKLSEKQLQLLQQYEGPLVKIATHYHVGFGDCLKVVGSCDEFGAWNADQAPLMKWGEGDVWSLVVPLPPGDHEFKVVVQQASGNLVWEAGDLNRIVSVPDDAPVGSMLTSVCAFNIIDGSAESKLKPVTADVLELLEASLAEEKALEEARAAAEEAAAAVEAEKTRLAGAAAAVAKALATMDAEAEEKGIRPRTSSDSDSDEPLIPPPKPRWPAAAVDAAPVAADATPAEDSSSTPGPSSGSDSDENAGGMRKKASKWAALKDSEDAGESSGRSHAGPAVVAAAIAEAPARQQLPQQQQEDEVAAAALKYEMALKQSEGEQAAQEGNQEAVSQEVSDEQLSSTPSYAQSTAAAVHAKLAQGKPVAVGFVDKSGPSAGTSSVVAAFMKSVGGKVPAAAAATPAQQPAEPAPAAVAATAAAASTAAAPAAAAAAAPAAAEPEMKTSATAAAAAPAETAMQQGTQPLADAARAAAPAAPAAAPAAPAAASGAAASGSNELPKGWGPSAGASKYPARASSSASSSLSAASTASSGYSSESDTPSSTRAAFSSSMVSTAAGTPPNSPKKAQRPPSPGRGSSHVVSAAAAAAVAAEWIESVRQNDVVSAAREAEKAASELAARLQQARQKKSEAAAEAEMLNESLKHSSMVKGVVVGGNGSSGGMAAAAGAVGNTIGFMSMGRSKVTADTSAAAAAASSNPLAPPPITPMGGTPAFAAASSALSTSAAAGAGPSPPPVTHVPTGSQRGSVSTQAVSVSSSGSGGAGALTASGGFSAAPAELSEAPDGSVGVGGGLPEEAMQMLAAVVGCAAVGTVLWSEFVLKDTGCGLPPGPFGLLGAAEGLSYLTVLGFAGAGVAARVKSGGKQGLQGPLVVPETLAYGALAAGLLVLASQLNQYGYIPPPLPGGQCFADAVAIPGGEALNQQFAALQAIFAEGMDKLHLQQQIAILQAQVEHFSGYVSAQAEVLDLQMQVSLLELQTGLDSATLAVSSFVDSQLQSIDMSGKLSHVLDILRTQEQQLKVELPQQLAELQQLAATSMAVVHETALQASGSAHLPELLSSLDQVMSMLHGVLETRINQLDVVLTQLQGSIGAAAGQLSAAVAAAEQSGSKEAAAQMQSLQGALSDAMADVQSQVWAGYQQLALADKLSDMLLTVRTSAASVASSTASEVDKLRLREQLQQLEGMAESSAAALAANAVDSIQQLQLDERLSSIAAQASAAAASLQAGMKMQYEQTLPAVQSQVASLQASLSGLAAKTEAGQGVRGPELSSMLRELQHSMDSTMKLVGEVATSSVTAAGDAVQGAGKAATSSLAAVNEQLGAATGSVSASLATGFQSAGEAVQGAGKAASSGLAAVTDQLEAATESVGASLAPSAPQVAVSSAVVDAAAPLVAAVRDISPAAATAAADAGAAAMHAAAPAGKEFVVDSNAVAAAYAEAVEAGLDWNTLVAYALPDHKETLQSLPTPEIFNADGVRFKSLTDASDTIKSIWFNRPQ